MLIAVTPTMAWPVSVEEVRNHARAPDDGSDDYILQVYLETATAHAESKSGRVFRQISLQYLIGAWPSDRRIRVPVVPVRDVDNIEYFDVSGALKSVPAGDYRFERVDEGVAITFADGWVPPALQTSRLWPVRVTVLAGCNIPGASGSDVDPALTLPPQARAAILMLAAKYYEHRGDEESEGVQRAAKASNDLLAMIRVYR
jgi:uncharacterized phiE125 gp8 family phage protein